MLSLLLFFLGIFPLLSVAKPAPPARPTPQGQSAPVVSAMTQPTPVSVADAVCAKCHEQIYQNYLKTPMANASGLANQHLDFGSFNDPHSQMDYRFTEYNGQPVLAWKDLRDPGVSGHWNLYYYLGSGHFGTTWLYAINHYWFESPVAWYTKSHNFYMKPGLAKAGQMLPALFMQSTCMRCHMSSVQASVPGSLNLFRGLPFLHGGITCESCHGDATQHVKSGGRIPVVDPAKLTPEKRDSICISCHLEGDISVVRAGKSLLNFRPGDNISDFLVHYVYVKSNPLSRSVSEVEQFNQSMCRRVTGPSMSCTTCHDPHYSPQPTQVVAYYRSKCLQCHNNAAFLKTHFPKNPSCISCHMPHSTSLDIPHVAWTDHRILARPDPLDTSDAGVTDVLKPIFSPGATQRDLGMAYYLAWLKGNRAEESKAWAILHPLRTQLQNDKAALDALGILSAGKHQYKDAQEDFQRVLTLAPHDLTAQSDFGILLAKEGKLEQSEKMLQRAFSRNEDVVGLAVNLAHVQCMLGDVPAVQETLRTALLYNPGVEQMQDFIRQAPNACGTTSQFTPAQ